MQTIDVRGLSCPEPVMLTLQALKDLPGGETLEVLVETVTSRENIRRMASSKGCTVQVETSGDGFRMLIQKTA